MKKLMGWIFPILAASVIVFQLILAALYVMDKEYRDEVAQEEAIGL